MTRRARIFLFTGTALFVLLLAAIIAGIQVVRSAWFREQVRSRIVQEVERATGGTVELGNFQFDWRTLTARVERFQLHGTEPATEKPFVTVQKAELRLSIVSALKRDVDLQLLRVEHAEVNIVVDEHGNNNIPTPKLPGTQHTPPLEHLLKTQIERLELVDGSFHYGSKTIPLNLSADGVKADLQYDRSGPRYHGTLQSRQLYLDAPGALKWSASLDAAVTLERDRIQASKLQLQFGKSSADLSGWIEELEHPRIELTGRLSMTASELIKIFALPVLRGGTATARGTFRYDPLNSYSFRGEVTGNNISAGQSMWRVSNGNLKAAVHVAPDLLELTNLKLRSTQGDMDGTLSLRKWHEFDLTGKLDRVSIQEWVQILGQPDIVWQGQVSGNAHLRGRINSDGITGLTAASRLVIARQEGPHPVEGVVDFELDQNRGWLRFNNSSIAFANTRLAVEGNLGERLRVEADSSDLRDLAPLIHLAGGDSSKPLPFALKGGIASFRGTATGQLAAPRIEGRLSVTRVEMDNQLLEQIAADVTIDKSSAVVRNLKARQGEFELQGSADAELTNWKLEDRGAISVNMSLRNAKLGPILKEFGAALPIDGLATVTAAFKGTLAAPTGTLRLDVAKPELWGERLDSLNAVLQLSRTRVEVTSANLAVGATRLRVGGAFEHPDGVWKSGTVRFTVSSPNIALGTLQKVKENIGGLNGSLNAQAEGTGKIENGEFLLTGLTGKLVSKNMTLYDKPLGEISVDAKSNGQQLQAHADARISESKVTADARIELTGSYPIKGELVAEPLSLATLQNLLSKEPNGQARVITGSLDGRVAFAGQLRNFDKLTGVATISRFEIRPREAKETLGAKAAAVDLTLRNNGPVKLSWQGGSVRIESAHFVAKDTNLSIDGTFSPGVKQPWDLKLKGDLNLAILHSFNPELKVSGTSVMDATVRGSLDQPTLTGRLELKNASLSIADIPNSIDNVNGSLVFDRNRIVIRELKAQSGGGDIALRGFVGFGGRELAYRLQADATNVRVRYPEGVSTTFDANLNFSGTLERSLLSGTATITRSGFNAKTDFGGIFASSVKPVDSEVSANSFLQGLQLDVTVLTASNFQLLTSYTKNVQTDARLRVRGTAAKPSVLGRILVSEGEIDFFGGRYTVTRGEVNFYNPNAIEPVLDADLEAKVRAITVGIKVSGTPSRLQVSYRSDPPLSSAEIVSLLTVGRSPSSTPSNALQGSFNESGAAGGGGALLGQVLSTSVSGALQKFFGVSRVKIDPRAIGVDGTPQAQLTVEQQLSRDVTLTYSTSLQNSQQQIVRAEWNVSKRWSAVAVRDQYGVFGIDFFYKRRLK